MDIWILKTKVICIFGSWQLKTAKDGPLELIFKLKIKKPNKTTKTTVLSWNIKSKGSSNQSMFNWSLTMSLHLPGKQHLGLTPPLYLWSISTSSLICIWTNSIAVFPPNNKPCTVANSCLSVLDCCDMDAHQREICPSPYLWTHISSFHTIEQWKNYTNYSTKFVSPTPLLWIGILEIWHNNTIND